MLYKRQNDVALSYFRTLKDNCFNLPKTNKKNRRLWNEKKNLSYTLNVAKVNRQSSGEEK